MKRECQLRGNDYTYFSGYRSGPAWHESWIPLLSMLDFIDQKINKMNAS
jgi:hypothetical protein